MDPESLYQLPDDVFPRHYDLTLKIDSGDGEDETKLIGLKTNLFARKLPPEFYWLSHDGMEEYNN